jgi:hypothetical protein
MKTIITNGIIFFAFALLAPQITHAQGTTTYLSNLDLTSAGSLGVGSDSWYAALFITGTNSSGYTLDSIQLAMTDATGNPSGFTAMIYSAIFGGAVTPGSNLGNLDGSLSPVAGGIFTYTPASNLTLSSSTTYFIVLTAGTAVANGAYDWSHAGTYSYNENGGWRTFADILPSSDGLSWRPPILSSNAQFAINAIPVPEPDVLGLFGFGGLAFLWHRRKAKRA